LAKYVVTLHNPAGKKASANDIFNWLKDLRPYALKAVEQHLNTLTNNGELVCQKDKGGSATIYNFES